MSQNTSHAAIYGPDIGDTTWPATCPLCGQPAPPVKRLVLLDDGHTVYVDGAPIRLQRQTFVLLEALHEIHPRAARYDFLIARLWPVEDEPDSAVKIAQVAVCKMRRLLSRTALEIETVWGVGYRLKWMEEK